MTEKKVLIIDDEPDVISYLTVVLESNGFRPYSATTAENGFNLAVEVEPDLICVDIMMPQESGLSLFVKLRRESKFNDIPVLIISGLEQEQDFDFRKFVDSEDVSPPDLYIEKPIKVERFIEAVRKLTSSTHVKK
jgi:DNA-binding response OmpR family regulator